MCWKCKKPINGDSAIFRTTVCDFCGADVKCCKNCTFYSVGAHYDCRETIGELVVDKERANFCDYFKLAVQNSNAKPTNQDAKKTFNNLFGD